MKPTPITSPKPRRRCVALLDPPLSFPGTDCHYRPVSSSVSAATSDPNCASELRKFRSISNDFLGAETTRSYAREAALFVIISLVSVWPIGLMIRELVRFLK